MVHAGGRPRTTVPEKEELIKLGQDLVQWATEETDELRCRYCQWYCLKHGFVRKHWDLMLQKPEFRVYYEMAQASLAKRYIDGSINPSIAHRLLPIYLPEVKEEEKEAKKFESDLRKEESSFISKEQEEKHESILKKVDDLLSKSSKN